MATITKRLLYHVGEAFQRQTADGLLFEKDILSVGDWVHPSTSDVLHFDLARLQRLVQNTNEWAGLGNEIMFPRGHTFDPVENLGVWHPPFKLLGDRIQAVVEILDPKAIASVANKTLRGVSVFIEFNVLGQDGKVWDEVITHVAATNEPVLPAGEGSLTGQEDFVRLAREESKRGFELYVFKAALDRQNGGDLMDKEKLKKLAASVGLPETATEDEVLAKVEQLAKDKKEAEEKATAASAASEKAIKEAGYFVKDGKLEKLSVETIPQPGDTAEVTAIKEELGRVRATQELSSAQGATAFVDRLIKEGRIPPALREDVVRIASLTGEGSSVMLGTGGGTVERIQLDLKTSVESLLSKLPSMTTALSRSGGGESEGSTEASTKRREHGVALAKKRMEATAEPK